MSAFFELHKDLPREGPGDLESLNWAFSNIDLAQSAVILDAACGPGADIEGLLGQVPLGRVVGLDKHQPFVDVATSKFANHDRVQIVQGDMATPPGGSYDAIWCAGALYFLGVEAGLKAWSAHIKPGGFVIFSEPLFFTDAPSQGAMSFWDGHKTGSQADVLNAIEKAGYHLIAERKLPDAAWEAYYVPMEARITQLRKLADPSLEAVLDEGDAEISGWRAHKSETGYGQFVVQAKS